MISPSLRRRRIAAGLGGGVDQDVDRPAEEAHSPRPRRCAHLLVAGGVGDARRPPCAGLRAASSAAAAARRSRIAGQQSDVGAFLRQHARHRLADAAAAAGDERALAFELQRSMAEPSDAAGGARGRSCSDRPRSTARRPRQVVSAAPEPARRRVQLGHRHHAAVQRRRCVRPGSFRRSMLAIEVHVVRVGLRRRRRVGRRRRVRVGLDQQSSRPAGTPSGSESLCMLSA